MAEPSAPPSALAGVRVLAFATTMAGAVSTMLLADHGAEVVLVEPPGGSRLRDGAAHAVWNRGKRSVVLDLEVTADREVARRLAAGADVVVDDTPVGHLAAHGLSATDVTAANPDVVCTSISPYGLTGPWRDRPGNATSVAAFLGVMAEWSGAREGPIFLGHPALEYGTALLATIGALSALRARVLDGTGDHVDVSLLDGALALYPMNWWSERAESSIEAKSTGGQLSFGNKRLLLRSLECADGTLLQLHTGSAGGFDRAMRVFGLDHLIAPAQGPIDMASDLSDDEVAVLRDRLPAILRSRTRDEWLRLLWSNEIAALPIQAPGLVLDDDQVRYAGVVVGLTDPELGDIEVVGPVVGLSETPGAVQGAAPLLDADGAALRTRGWVSPGLERGRGAAPLARPLDGVRILELSTFFAAPYGNRLLSDLGAAVVKLEAIHGDPMRPLTQFFEGANRGKEGVAADLKNPAIAPVLRSLVQAADVVQHNLRPGVAERLGIDAASLRAINPGLVYHYSPGFGAAGPKSMLQSFAPLQAGFVGQLVVGAGAGNPPHPVFGNEDYYNGLLGACGCLVALLHRERTGRGQVVETPQLHSSVLTTSEFYKQAGSVRSALPTLDSGLFGWSAVHRIYQTLDGWICVAGDGPAALADLAVTVLGRAADPVNTEVDGDLAQLLTYAFVGRTTEDWLAQLRTTTLVVEPVRETSWLASGCWTDPDLLAAGRIVALDHPVFGPIRIVGDLVHSARRSPGGKGRAPLLGEHTAPVLTALGLDQKVQDELAADGAVRAR
ncbi:MAG TPA: CoA transferase [Mycobacteriales bacterium]|nr:CoA transferase [Mycobacteriales bacterium]